MIYEEYGGEYWFFIVVVIMEDGCNYIYMVRGGIVIVAQGGFYRNFRNHVRKKIRSI